MSKRAIALVAASALFVLAFAPAAFAADAFLCPVVGKGGLTAPGRAEVVIEPPVGTSFLPGKNQAGAHANYNAYNTMGPGSEDAGPGHNPDFSPIWPPAQ